MEKHLHDRVLGFLTYNNYSWTRDYSYTLFGQPVNVRLVVRCDEGDEIENSQREAFAKFDADKDKFARQAEQAIFLYYQSVCDECRERFGGDSADEWAPIIHDPIQLKSLIRASAVFVKRGFGSPNRVVGLLFTCSWEQELGLAVKFVDEVIEEVGPQDIVL